MKTASEVLRALTADIQNLKFGTTDGATLVKEIEKLEAQHLKTLESSADLKAVAKIAGANSAQILIDSAAMLGILNAWQAQLSKRSDAAWKDPQLGQARVHKYVDLWGRGMSAESLLTDIISDCKNSMKASQVNARLESLRDGIKQVLFDTAQSLMLSGEIQNLSPVLTWTLGKFEGNGFKALTGSILKELHSF